MTEAGIGPPPMDVHMKLLARIIATGFGLGYSPLASGTVASVLGVALAVFLAVTGVPPLWQVFIAVCLSLMAIAVCDVAERHFGTKDDHRIVADEYMTFPIVLIGIPWLQHPWFILLAFGVTRALDIIKPPPARQIQRVKGGAGIVLDDLISNIYALGLNHLLWLALMRMYPSVI